MKWGYGGFRGKILWSAGREERRGWVGSAVALIRVKEVRQVVSGTVGPGVRCVTFEEG